MFDGAYPSPDTKTPSYPHFHLYNLEVGSFLDGLNKKYQTGFKKSEVHLLADNAENSFFTPRAIIFTPARGSVIMRKIKLTGEKV
jgi:hypothetical protein